jgi:hypothetical protein
LRIRLAVTQISFALDLRLIEDEQCLSSADTALCDSDSSRRRSFPPLSYAVICCPVNQHFSFQVLFMDTDYQKFCIMRCPQAALKRIDSPGEIFKQIPLPECLLELITDPREQI